MDEQCIKEVTELSDRMARVTMQEFGNWADEARKSGSSLYPRGAAVTIIAGSLKSYAEIMAMIYEAEKRDVNINEICTIAREIFDASMLDMRRNLKNKYPQE